MSILSKNEELLLKNVLQVTIWQEVTDGVPEQALQLRTYDGSEFAGHLIEIRQGADTILINSETVGELVKVLRRMEKGQTE